MLKRIRIILFALVLAAATCAVNGADLCANPAWAQEGESPAELAPDQSLVLKRPKKIPPPRVAGAWCGSIQDNLLGSGAITLAIKQSGRKLSGRWTDDFGGFGTLGGNIQGTALTLTAVDKASRCKIAVTGILVNPSELTGTYAQFGCHQADGGSFDITSPSC